MSVWPSTFDCVCVCVCMCWCLTLPLGSTTEHKHSVKTRRGKLERRQTEAERVRSRAEKINKRYLAALCSAGMSSWPRTAQQHKEAPLQQRHTRAHFTGAHSGALAASLSLFSEVRRDDSGCVGLAGRQWAKSRLNM